MASIYLENGYLDIKKLFDLPEAFVFCVGGRGTGKTYGVLKELIERGEKFIYMRLIGRQIDECAGSGNPFKKLNTDLGTDIRFETEGVHKVFSLYIDGKKEREIGYAAALSTFGNVRGVDYSDVNYILLDEFIAETITSERRGMCEALQNAYETVNRNRELEGLPPVKMICCSNSNRIVNPIFSGLNLLRPVISLVKSEQEFARFPDRSCAICVLKHSPISEQKSKTALYRLSSGTEYNEMAIENIFRDFDESGVAPRPLIEYIPIVTVGEITIGIHKNGNSYYVTKPNKNARTKLTTSKIDIQRVRRLYPFIWHDYLVCKTVFFADFESKVCFEEYFS